MKMKQLRSKLSLCGYEVSERMIKYYIEIGLLPEPDYPEINQANYFDIHYLRLMKISSLKQKGVSFNDIKRIIEKDNQNAEKYANENNIDIRDAYKSSKIYMDEYTNYCFNYADENKMYTYEELMESIGCERMVFDIAVDTKLIEKKSEYSHTDMLILISVSNIFAFDEISSGTIEKIGEISKVNTIANQLANLYSKSETNMKLYKNLTDSLLKGRLEELCQNRI